jgi:hypothetical protein
MKQPTLTPSGKPFNLHDRLLLFACDVVRAVEFLHKRGPVGLKEAKEARFRLRVCRLTDLLDARFDPLVSESDEIVRIPGKIVHNAIRRRASDSISPPSSSGL